MCHFLAVSLSALGEFTSKRVAFLKLTYVEQPSTLYKTSWLCVLQGVAGLSGMGHLQCFYNPNNPCSSVLLLPAFCFMVGTVKNTNDSCTRFKLTQQIHAKVILGTDSKWGSLRYVLLGFPSADSRWSSYDCFEWGKSHQYFMALQSVVTCQVLMAMALHQACCIPFPPQLLAALCEWQ